MNIAIAGPADETRVREVIGKNGQTRMESLAFLVFVSSFVFSALEAYDLGSLPFTYLGEAIVICLSLYLFLNGCRPRIEGLLLIAVFVTWVLSVGIIFSYTGSYSGLLPMKASLPYGWFIAVRYVNLVAFVATTAVVSFLFDVGFRDRLYDAISMVGVCVSVATLYIYVAQLQGWPEPPRNRVGTGGAEQIIAFSYDFHRAVGTFREPSHLAEWLVLPLFVTLRLKGSKRVVRGVLVLSAMLLTGSLTGIVGGAVGYFIISSLSGMFTRTNVKVVAAVTALTVVSYLGFSAVVSSNTQDGVNLARTLTERIEPILLEGGLKESNRGYIYEYVDFATISLTGVGIGNANLLLTEFLNIDAMASFLSLYFNSLYGSGIVGLTLLVLVLLVPLRRLWHSRRGHNSLTVLLLGASYIAWIVMFSVRAEELSFIFAVNWALLGRELSKSYNDRALQI